MYKDSDLMDDDVVELKNVDISYLMLNFQKGIFGGNKRYIISCGK